MKRKVTICGNISKLLETLKDDKMNIIYIQGAKFLNESLKWLRSKLRYGENPSYEDTNVSEIDNQQPSL
jgi:hypothetical protein